MKATLESELARLQQMPNGSVKARAIKGLSTDAPYCAPTVTGGRIAMLDRMEVVVILEDPFFEPGRHPIRLTLADFQNWQRQPLPAYVLSEHERLRVKLPADYTERTTGLLRRYEELLTDARDAISEELRRVRKIQDGSEQLL